MAPIRNMSLYGRTPTGAVPAATALDRIALVLADKYRHLTGTESIRLTHPHDSEVSCIWISPTLIGPRGEEMCVDSV
jgi:hypothetical protein